ncbi:MAG: hypothetical protein MZU79_09205 [Anaerotruncus sp.]|nr:hypothetical protein [Anaerotruncus sp.]
MMNIPMRFSIHEIMARIQGLLHAADGALQDAAFSGDWDGDHRDPRWQPWRCRG